MILTKYSVYHRLDFNLIGKNIVTNIKTYRFKYIETYYFFIYKLKINYDNFKYYIKKLDTIINQYLIYLIHVVSLM